MPMGEPGWPDFAFSTASTARKRIVLTQSSSSLSFSPAFGSLLASAASIAELASWATLLMRNLRSGGQRPSAVRTAEGGRPPWERGLYSAVLIRKCMQDDSVTVKGSPVRSLQKFIEKELTPAQRESVFRAVPGDFAARLRGPILPTETIPVSVLNQLTEEAARAKGEPVEQFARRAGREAAADAVKGIYRFFALVLTTTALLSRASQMWSSLYNRGEMRVENQTDRGATIKLTNFPSEVAGCARITGWIERMAELTGVKDVRIQQTQCYAKGGPHCEWSITWN